MQNKKMTVPVYIKESDNDSAVIECGRLPYEMVGDYIAKVMKSIAELKANSNFNDFCAFDWDLELCVYPTIRIPKTPIYSKIRIIRHSPHYNASICKVRSINGCLRKIKRGGCNGCKDKFITENVVNVFFANKNKDDTER